MDRNLKTSILSDLKIQRFKNNDSQKSQKNQILKKLERDCSAKPSIAKNLTKALNAEKKIPYITEDIQRPSKQSKMDVLMVGETVASTASPLQKIQESKLKPSEIPSDSLLNETVLTERDNLKSIIRVPPVMFQQQGSDLLSDNLNQKHTLAIIPQIGTSLNAPTATRKTKTLPNSTLKKKKIDKSLTKFLPTNVAVEKMSKELDSMSRSEEDGSATCQKAMKSSEQLLDEAKRIAGIDDSADVQSFRKSVQAEFNANLEDRKYPRNVDEIIASLKELQQDLPERKSLAEDRRLDELINRVLGVEDNASNENGIQEQQEEQEMIDEGVDSTTVGEIELEGFPANENFIQLADQSNEFDLPIRDTLSSNRTEESETTQSERPPETLPKFFNSEASFYEASARSINLIPVTYEDVVSVKGKFINPQSKQIKNHDVISKTVINDDEQIQKEDLEKSIHYFCKLFNYDSQYSGEEERNQCQINHVPDKFGFYRSNENEKNNQLEKKSSRLPSESPSSLKMQSFDNDDQVKENRNFEEAAERVMTEKEKIEDWELLAQHVLMNEMKEEFSSDPNLLAIQGQQLLVHSRPLGPNWEPPPPKMITSPTLVENVLFPLYEGMDLQSELLENQTMICEQNNNIFVPTIALNESGEKARKSNSSANYSRRNSSVSRKMDQIEQIDRILSRRHRSFENVHLNSEQNSTTITALPECALGEIKLIDQLQYDSMPNIAVMEDESLVIHLKYPDLMDELNSQINLIKNIEHNKKLSKKLRSNEEAELDTLAAISTTITMADGFEKLNQDAHSNINSNPAIIPPNLTCNQDQENASIAENDYINNNNMQQTWVLTESEKALIGGRKYIYYNQKLITSPLPNLKSKQKLSINLKRYNDIVNFLSKQPKLISRRNSITHLEQNQPSSEDAFWNQLNKELSTSSISSPSNQTDQKYLEEATTHLTMLSISRDKCRSESHVENFDNWAVKNGYNSAVIDEDKKRDWVVIIWDQWFGEVYPVSNASMGDTGILDDSVNDEHDILMISTTKKHRENIQASQKLESDAIWPLPEKIDSCLKNVDLEEQNAILMDIEEEIAQLSIQIDKCDSSNKPNAFLYSRRGALRQKLGYLLDAFHDVNQAILIEPEFIIAYWHRHLLFLLQNRTSDALEDLNYILKRHRTFQQAYKSRAEIYDRLKEYSLAGTNYSQAIRLNPNDSDAYLKRAEMYENIHEDRLALEDYNKVLELQPDNIHALYRHSLYYFKTEQWQYAVHDFSELLKRQPSNADALMLRGKCLAKLKEWNGALADISAVIHLLPDHAEAFYMRGMLLRKANPSFALRDLSISLLYDSSEQNVNAFLIRAIIYCSQKRFEEAIIDYEMVISLKQDIPVAHCNLGLIYFKLNDYQKALKYFTSALKMDPTYVRSLVCRAETKAVIGDYKAALKDINCAIHFYPDRSNYYMLRGDFLLSMERMEEAAFCVQQASVISEKMGDSPMQQALVYSFLDDFHNAIDVLENGSKAKPTLQLLDLLGRTQMKDQRWRDSIDTFQKSLDLMKPKSSFQKWPSSAAEINFLIAQCFMELKNYRKALDYLLNAIKIKPNYAEAYYNRGLCKLRIGLSRKGIQDLNQALAMNPKFYLAYLCRAAHFGMTDRFAKAILNCNEVLRIQPQSLRGYLYRGALKYQIGAFSLAVHDLTKATKIDKSCSLAYFNRAVCYHMEGLNYGMALRDYGIVLLLPDSFNLHYKVLINRGLLYLHMRDLKNALTDFLYADRQMPDNYRLLYAIGICHHKIGNLQSAIDYFTKAIRTNSSFYDSLVARGNVFMDMLTNQARECAKEDYLRVLQVDPRHLSARLNYAYCIQADGRFKLAWEEFSQAIQIEPSASLAFEGRGMVCLQMAQMDAALKDLNEAIRLNPGFAKLYNNRGVIFQYKNDFVRAMQDFQKAISIDETLGHAYFNRGLVYISNCQIEQAHAAFEKANSILSRDESVLACISLTFSLLSKFEESLDKINAAIKLNPHLSYLHFNRGQLLMRINNQKSLEEADKSFSRALQISRENVKLFKSRADCRAKLDRKEAAIQDYKMAIYIGYLKKK